MTKHEGLTPSEDAPQDFDLDAWIDGISPTQRSVPIYARPDIMGRYEEIQRQVSVLEAAARKGETSVTEQGELAALYAERDGLYEQWIGSKTTWYVQALDDDVIRDIEATHPVPELPTVPPQPRPDAPKAAHDAHAAAVKKRDTAAAKPKYRDALDARHIAFVAAAVVRIEDHTGRTVATNVTADQLRAMRAKPRGVLQVGSLLAAALQAKAQDPVIPAPFSPAKSGNAPG